MKFKRIRTRMLVFVIPVLVIVILVSCIFSITKMTESVSAVTEDYMNATLDGKAVVSAASMVSVGAGELKQGWDNCRGRNSRYCRCL